MKANDRTPKSQSHSLSRILPLIGVGALILGLLAIMPGAWALPEQAPDFQTVPTLTPTPVGPGPSATPTEPGAIATPTQPRATPTEPGAGATPTQPVVPSNTPVPGVTPTQIPTTATSTSTPGAVTATAIASTTPTRLATVSPLAPNTCWTRATPGFQAVRWQGLEFEAASDQGLVVPAQTLTLRLAATNRGSQVVRNVVICNPLDPRLQRGKPIVSQGRATLVPEGLVVEVGDLAPGKSVKVEVPLTIPPNFPLGGVIEDQAWLLAAEQQVSTGLLTWALPPAYLPPTGN